MSKKKRDTSKKRESIRNAAIEAFCEEGYETASMDRIAERAGASKRTVYNHFESKEVLFQAVIEKFVGEMYSLKQIPYDSRRSLEEQLGDFAEAEIALIKNKSWLGIVKVLLTVFNRDPQVARQTMAKYENGEDTLVSWINAAVRDGRLSVKDPQLAARVFWSMLGGAFTWPAMYQNYFDEKMIPVLKQELIETFLSRYRAGRG